MSGVTELKQVLNAIISANGNSCSERDLRRAYQEETGENLNFKIQSIRANSLTDFLRTQCADFCRITRDGFGIIAHRTNSEKSEHLDGFTKSGQRNLRQHQQHYQPQRIQQQHRPPPQNLFPSTLANMDASKVQIALKQNFFWYNANRQLLNPSNISPTAQIGLVQMDIAFNVIFEICRYNEHMLRQQNLQQKQQIDFLEKLLGQIKLKPPIESTSTVLKSLPEAPISSTNEKQESQQDKDCFPSLTPMIIEAESAEPETKIEECSTIQELETSIDEPLNSLEGHIVVVESPERFWFQFDDENLSDLMNKMQAFYSFLSEEKTQSTEDLSEDEVVCVKMYGCWHRAKILHVDGDEVHLRFIDFGSQHVVTKQQTRYLLSDFKTVRAFAFQGCLTRIAPLSSSGDSWEQNATDAFYDKVINKPLRADIIKHREIEDIYELEIFDEASNIAEQLISDGFAQRR